MQQSDLEAAKSRIKELDEQISNMNAQLLKHQSDSASFREEISRLLSDNSIQVEANENKIKECIQLLMSSSIDRGIVSVFLIISHINVSNNFVKPCL